MASANTLRCLARPAVPSPARLQPIFVRSAAFSTTSNLLAGGGDRRNLPGAIKKSFKKKGAETTTTVKKPQPGERKNFRKRIQLSNNSALAVPGLETVNETTMLDVSSAGKVYAMPDQVVDQLRALEAFKPAQTWNLFRKPHFLVRKETVKLIEKLGKASGEKAEALRCVLTGSRLSGKSLALVQAMTHALLNGWVVIHIPEGSSSLLRLISRFPNRLTRYSGQDLTNGNTEFAPIPDTKPVQLSQPVYANKLLHNILNANEKILSSLKTQKDWNHIAHQKPDSTLADLVHSARETDAMWPTLNALWTELTLPGRPPVLLGLDGLAHINKISAYRDPEFNLVHAHDLALVRLFVDAISGKKKLPNGGAVLAATSGNNTLYHPSQELVLSQIEAGQKRASEMPKPDPYERGYDERVYESLKTCEVLRFDGVLKSEARALMEYWGASGMLRHTVDQRTVAEKWALGGSGNVGEMERASLMTMRV